MMKILFSGGGTLGSVAPLLAIKEIYSKENPDAKFIWVGTRNGPEKELLSESKIPFFIISSGKLRRYFSLLNIIDLFKLFWGFLESMVLLWQEKPNLLVSAGGFVSVPLHWAARWLGIPTWIHQQDFQVGLANKIMLKSAKKITTALKESVKYFSEKKTEWIGNPVRDLSVGNTNESRKIFGIPEGVPVIFAVGGGTGSIKLNTMVLQALSSWPKDWHIIHLLGKERPKELQELAAKTFSNYHVYDFFNSEMKDAYAVADVVIARAGFGTISELASLSKVAILIPMSETHQEENVRALTKEKAVIVLDERTTEGVKLAQVVKDLISRPDVREYLGKRLHVVLPTASPEKIIEVIEMLVQAHH